jgi:hypothetical protein
MFAQAFTKTYFNSLFLSKEDINNYFRLTFTERIDRIYNLNNNVTLSEQDKEFKKIYVSNNRKNKINYLYDIYIQKFIDTDQKMKLNKSVIDKLNKEIYTDKINKVRLPEEKITIPLLKSITTDRHILNSLLYRFGEDNNSKVMNSNSMNLKFIQLKQLIENDDKRYEIIYILRNYNKTTKHLPFSVEDFKISAKKRKEE